VSSCLSAEISVNGLAVVCREVHGYKKGSISKGGSDFKKNGGQFCMSGLICAGVQCSACVVESLQMRLLPDDECCAVSVISAFEKVKGNFLLWCNLNF